MAPQLAFSGLGNMGKGMAKNLAEKGQLDKPLILFNRTEKKATEFAKTLASGKSIVASTIEELVLKSDIIFTCVGDDAAIISTIDTALKSNAKGKLFVDCSTIHPDTSTSISKKVTEAGAEFVACPVFGPPALAEAGQLLCVLAGPKESVEKVKPYTKGVMGRADVDFGGEPVKKALLLKIVGNGFIINMVEALSESLVLAEKCGLGTDTLHRFVEGVFPGPYPAYSTRMLSGDYYKREEPLFAVDLARKDARHVMDLAKTILYAGTRMQMVEVADAHLKQVKEYSGEKGEFAAIYGAVRQEAGLKFEN